MKHLPITIIAALAMSASIFNNSGSIWLAFLAYSLTGTIVLLSIMLTDALDQQSENQLSTTE